MQEAHNSRLMRMYCWSACRTCSPNTGHSQFIALQTDADTSKQMHTFKKHVFILFSRPLSSGSVSRLRVHAYHLPKDTKGNQNLPPPSLQHSRSISQWHNGGSQLLEFCSHKCIGLSGTPSSMLESVRFLPTTVFSFYALDAQRGDAQCGISSPEEGTRATKGKQKEMRTRDERLRIEKLLNPLPVAFNISFLWVFPS